ncbi:MAG: hypothetical protein IH787_06915, partial [Nitrospirae bacterium]|nr:hypothetical protein [Nitrospirota bacterium]
MHEHRGDLNLYAAHAQQALFLRLRLDLLIELEEERQQLVHQWRIFVHGALQHLGDVVRRRLQKKRLSGLVAELPVKLE